MEAGFAQPPEILKLAGHPIRWNLLTMLARSDERVQDLIERLKLPQNLVSYHLRQLREGQLVTERRSSADERSVYYSLDLEQFQTRFLSVGNVLHPAIVTAAFDESALQQQSRDKPPLRVLFLCTHNSARSQMAEALLRHLSHDTIEAYSAGSSPVARIHPFALRAMEAIDINMHEQYPKHFEHYRGQHFDAIITVCDLIREACPAFPGDPERIHWSFLDPAEAMGSDEEQYAVFQHMGLQLSTRLRLLIILLRREHR
jgi:ArsR family transcriptional regulator, arsenate/arsenite/antimonite-responsive transcriptional repressor / arsenate reductase (thioredoxin)